jgi:type VI secretion system protein ImpA
MGTIDVDRLLEPSSPDSPCGENLEYDPAYAEMELASKGKPEQQYGDTLVPAQEPDWRLVKAKATELLGRTKDLRIAVYLARALARTDGLPGLAEGLALLKGLVERHWDSLHPQLDPDDGYDPTLRVNTLAALNDPEATLRAVREAPLVSSRAMGRFSLRDVQLATGALPPPADGKVPDLAAIDGAFADCDLAALTQTATALETSLASAGAFQIAVSERVGSAQTVNLSELVKLLKAARQVVSERLSRRGAPAAAAPAAEGVSAPRPAPAIAPGSVASREDVIRTLDLLCDYFNRNEPSSPVPLLLQRAKRLVSKNFFEIVKDLAPEAVAQVELIRGPQGE